MTQEKFIATIDKAKLREIDLSRYDEDNLLFFETDTHLWIRCAKHLCFELKKNKGRHDCTGAINCRNCPLYKKSETIKFLKEDEK